MSSSGTLGGTNGKQILAMGKVRKKKKDNKKTTLGKYGGKGKGNPSSKALNCPML